MGVRETGRRRRHRTPLEVDHETTELDDRVRRSIGSAQRCAQTGEEVVDAERLRDVVVGARVECGDLLLLVADGREDEDRCVQPARSSRQTSVPLPSGSTRSRMTAFGGRIAAAASAAAAVETASTS